MKYQIIETYKDYDIYQDAEGFFITGIWRKEETIIYEDTIEEMKLLIDYL